ncbi:MAG: hypothetical protein ACJ8F3_00065 [Xanthobacteraceae bacterium]
MAMLGCSQSQSDQELLDAIAFLFVPEQEGAVHEAADTSWLRMEKRTEILYRTEILERGKRVKFVTTISSPQRCVFKLGRQALSTEPMPKDTRSVLISLNKGYSFAPVTEPSGIALRGAGVYCENKSCSDTAMVPIGQLADSSGSMAAIADRKLHAIDLVKRSCTEAPDKPGRPA